MALPFRSARIAVFARAQSFPFVQTEIRARMEEDEQLSVLMAGLRGSNINASDFADEDVVMQVTPPRTHFVFTSLQYCMLVSLNGLELDSQLESTCSPTQATRCR